VLHSFLLDSSLFTNRSKALPPHLFKSQTDLLVPPLVQSRPFSGDFPLLYWISPPRAWANLSPTTSWSPLARFFFFESFSTGFFAMGHVFQCFQDTTHVSERSPEAPVLQGQFFFFPSNFSFAESRTGPFDPCLCCAARPTLRLSFPQSFQLPVRKTCTFFFFSFLRPVENIFFPLQKPLLLSPPCRPRGYTQPTLSVMTAVAATFLPTGKPE